MTKVVISVVIAYYLIVDGVRERGGGRERERGVDKERGRWRERGKGRVLCPCHVPPPQWETVEGQDEREIKGLRDV